MKNATVIKILYSASGGPSKYDGQFVTRFDPDFMNGLGRVWTTADITKAKRFDSMYDAALFWKTESKVKPVREDGQPNRPLTAFTCEFPTVDE